MKWNAPAKPKIGDERIVDVFAWLPTRVGDKYVWLEHYQSIQRWERQFHGPEWVEVALRYSID